MDQSLIVTREAYHYLRLPLDQVIHLKSEGAYCHIYATRGRKFLTSHQLGKVEKAVAETDSVFIRVHERHLVNHRHITEVVTQGQWEVCLSDGSRVSVARRRREDLIRILCELDVFMTRVKPA